MALIKISTQTWYGLGTVCPRTVRPRTIRPFIVKEILYKNLTTNYFINPAPI